jgi:hypothetical protein
MLSGSTTVRNFDYVRQLQSSRMRENSAPIIDIRLPTHGLHSIRGAVTAGTDQHTVTSGTVSLLDPSDKAPLRQAEIQNDGSSSFNYVVNGAYLVSIEPAPVRTGRRMQSRSHR